MPYKLFSYIKENLLCVALGIIHIATFLICVYVCSHVRKRGKERGL